VTGPGDAGRREAHRRFGTGPDQDEVEADELAEERLNLGIPEPGDVGRMQARAKFHRDERARAALAAWRGRPSRR
jgi:hypothetical protein